VTVADVRRPFLTRQRFPEAYAVLMTHNYLRDLEYLSALLGAELAYLGVLGPRKRTLQLLRDLHRVDPIDRVQGPAGLDIGAEGPDEVAWAIVAEMLAVRRGRSGGFLRNRRAPIHAVE
jgi:xanthine dehydrogenase accessory factor